MKIDCIYEMLDSQNSLTIQSNGIKLACDMGEIEPFVLPLFPKHNKNIWENCAKIISTKTDEELVPFMEIILEWLQDLNWPGVFLIIDRLRVFNGLLLVVPYEKVVLTALNKPKDDFEWLDNLSILVENADLVRYLNCDLYKLLKERYISYWNQSVP